MDFWEYVIIETLRPCDFATLKPRNKKKQQKTLGPRNQDMLGPRNQETYILKHFSLEGIAPPLNIPTPTPAPDRPLGGHE